MEDDIGSHAQCLTMTTIDEMGEQGLTSPCGHPWAVEKHERYTMTHKGG